LSRTFSIVLVDTHGRLFLDGANARDFPGIENAASSQAIKLNLALRSLASLEVLSPSEENALGFIIGNLIRNLDAVLEDDSHDIHGSLSLA